MPKKPAVRYFIDRIKDKFKRQGERAEQFAEKTKKIQFNADSFTGLETLNMHFEKDIGNFFGEEKIKVKELCRRLKRNNKPLRTLENGAGMAFKSEQLKKELGKEGIPVHATAVDLNPAFKKIREMHGREKEIDKFVTKMTEFYEPEEEFDLIIDSYGTTSYTPKFIRKESVLKTAQSLRKGGVMLIQFGFFPRQIEWIKENLPYMILGGLSEKPKKGRTMPVQKEAKGIERAFEKRGFKAKFFFQDVPGSEEHIVRLIIQRKK